MPIKLIPPREGFSPYYYGRGTHIGVFVDKSTRATRPALAKRIIKSWERDIERGLFDQKAGLTFTDASVAYMEAGGHRRPVAKLVAHFGDDLLRPRDLPTDLTLAQHWQNKIDQAAATLFPTHTGATRNREVYSPSSAILKHAGLDFKIRRPKGSRGRELTGWLWPEQAEQLLIECYKLDPEFGLFCMFLLYTGIRLSEGSLWFTTDNLRISESYAFIPKTKNGTPHPIYLPPHLVVALANHPRGLERPGERVFRWHPGGRLYNMLYAAAEAAKVTLPDREAFHIFRHTHATWRLRYTGSTVKTLVDTGLWKSMQSANRYGHTVVSEEQRRADLLPAPKKADNG